MLKRKQIRAIRRFIQKIIQKTGKVSLAALRSRIKSLVRSLFVTPHRHSRSTAKAGFVLPTVTLLLLVLALVIGALLFRIGSRTNQVINERQQQVIYNAATPAIDRAKAKLEYLFKRDDRLPNSAPTEPVLLSALLNDGQNGITAEAQNPYILPDETQIPSLAGQVAPAWKYTTDIDGDGNQETIVYSILLKTIADPANPNSIRRESNDDRQKANNLIVRNGPITVQQAANPDCERLNLAPESGWDLVGTGSLRKTFQVDAVVVSNKGGNRTISTLEFQQDRELARANKWGAWFRYDLHLYPTPPFRWNGAMHTEGSLYLGPNNPDSIQSFLISAPKSCLYNPASNSEITIGRIEDSSNNILFAGQVFRGAIGMSSGFNQNSIVHIHGAQPNSTATITDTNDSVGSGSPENFALDPVVLFTEDRSKAIGGTGSGIQYSTNKWKNEETLDNTRFRANSESPPYVDDTYRADDRLGPKPRFDLEGRDNDFSLSATDANLKNGTPINNANINGTQKEQMARNEPRPNDVEMKTLGLDGYWERRARVEGLRIIVGQRLDLGNPNGWGVIDLPAPTDTPSEVDPLYPVYKSLLPNGTSHLQQQRRSLRDNPAAVQATAVYYYNQGNNGYFPVACMATTAHPGTLTSIDNSTNFSLAGAAASSYYYKYNVRPYDLYSDFFTGRGTNGWEFNIAPSSEFQPGTNLRSALNNLGNFAGDYENINRSGAFPPTQENNRVHPDPYLAMWGNFSNLRRAIEAPATNPVDPSQISIADQSYMHTAGCSLGMLAYNVNYFQQYNYATNQPDLTNLNTALAALSNSSTTADGEIEFTGGNVTVKLTGGSVLKTIPAAQLSPDIFVEAMPAALQPLGRLIVMKEQIARDRKFGFATSPTTPTPNVFQYTVKKLDSTSTNPDEKLTFLNKTYDKNGVSGTVQTLDVGCDFSRTTTTGNKYFGLDKDPDTFTFEEEKRFIRLAVSLCPTKPKFPSLYYVFPTDTHNRTTGAGITQPATEPYIAQTNTIPTNGNFDPVNIQTLATQFLPKAQGGWILPTGGSTNVPINPLSDIAFRIVQPDGSFLWVPFIDKGVFDGREMLSLRFLDIDLNRLKQGSIGGDNWFARSGLVYAFREDAVREDAIARPSGGDYTNPTAPIKTDARNPDAPTDPQVKSNGVSPKPVDFYPDPDRRPYGFRLRNGQDLRREPNNPRGLTFVSDNPVAIQGNFNLHSQEEFVGTLPDNFTPRNFYDDRTSLNAQFATVTGDTWRAAEILTDAIYVLSNNFVDGTIEDGLRNNGNNSYRSLSNIASQSWVREDGSASDAGSGSPIKIFRDGNPRRCLDGNISYCPPNRQEVQNPNVDRTSTGRRDQLNPAEDNTKVNATFVSGTVPARSNQGNGGLNNFPRFLENWNSKNLKILGSFIQLNFSTYATAPYDQDAFEPNENPDGNEYAYHTRPPNRLWGYDVALQLAPAGPLSRRFITAETPRSEFYEEPKANDFYICNLRRAIADDPNSQSDESLAQVNLECSP